MAHRKVHGRRKRYGKTEVVAGMGLMMTSLSSEAAVLRTQALRIACTTLCAAIDPARCRPHLGLRLSSPPPSNRLRRMAHRRHLLALAAGLALTAIGGAPAAEVRLVVQSSPLAGFRFYAGEESWNDMRVGDALELVREPGNPHDPHAVRVHWRGRMLGYLPRRENRHVAAQLDRGTPVRARIVKLAGRKNGRRQIKFEVYVDL